MTESGAQRLQRGAPAGGEGRRRALWRRQQQQQQEPPSPRPPLPPPPARRARRGPHRRHRHRPRRRFAPAGRPPAESLAPRRSGARVLWRARCPFKTPGVVVGGRCSPLHPPPFSSPRLSGCGITGRAAAGSPAETRLGLRCPALRWPPPSRRPARPVPPGAPGLDAGGGVWGGAAAAPGGSCRARLGAAGAGSLRVLPRPTPTPIPLSRGEVAGAGASLRPATRGDPAAVGYSKVRRPPVPRQARGGGGASGGRPGRSRPERVG